MFLSFESLTKVSSSYEYMYMDVSAQYKRGLDGGWRLLHTLPFCIPLSEWVNFWIIPLAGRESLILGDTKDIGDVGVSSVWHMYMGGVVNCRYVSHRSTCLRHKYNTSNSTWTRPCTNRRTKAEPQQIVAQRLLSCVQYHVQIKSSTEDLTRPTFCITVKYRVDPKAIGTPTPVEGASSLPAWILS